MTNNKFYDVACIGNYTKDTITSPAGTRYIDGGAINYAAHAIARLGIPVVVVTHLAKEDQRVIDKFSTSGIDACPTYTSESTCMHLDYPSDDPDQRTLSVTGIAGSITTQEVDCVQAKAAVIGSSLRGEVGMDVIQSLNKRKILVAIDVQGFVRVLRGQALINEPWEEMVETLKYVDYLKADAVEAEFLTGESDIDKAAQVFLSMGPREVVITHKNGVLVHTKDESYDRAFYPENLSGRSGRGDTCIGTYVAKRLTSSPAEASIWAAAVTSLKMENACPFDRPLSDVEALINARYNHGSTLN
jgi:sugar/nucleoside kinase (ribokinase family)